jgi:hypothetical protein
MSEPPERPAQPGAETHVPKAEVAALQAALDEAFNAVAGQPAEQVEERLRAALGEHGAHAPDDWVADAAARIAAGEPVAAEPGDA